MAFVGIRRKSNVITLFKGIRAWQAATKHAECHLRTAACSRQTELLDLGEGQGPGKGTRATAEGIALILISVLATERLNQVEERVRELVDAIEAQPPDDSPFRGHQKFADALAFVLTRPRELASRVLEIEISRTSGRAVIVYHDIGSKKRRHAEFTKPGATEGPLRVMAVLDGRVVAQIAADVRAMLLSLPDPLFGDEGARKQAKPQA